MQIWNEWSRWSSHFTIPLIWSVELLELWQGSTECAEFFFPAYMSYDVAHERLQTQLKPRNHFIHTVNHCTETCVFVSVVWDLLTLCFFSADTSRNYPWFAVKLCPGLTYKSLVFSFDVNLAKYRNLQRGLTSMLVSHLGILQLRFIQRNIQKGRKLKKKYECSFNTYTFRIIQIEMLFLNSVWLIRQSSWTF